MKQITQNQFDASISFIFNLGCSRFTSIASNINSGDLDTATDSWLTFNHVGGAVSSVLTQRRAIEVNLFKSCNLMSRGQCFVGCFLVYILRYDKGQLVVDFEFKYNKKKLYCHTQTDLPLDIAGYCD